MDLTKQKAQTNEGMLKEAERIFDEFAKTLEKQVVSSSTENSLVDWKSKFKELVELVKQMREAQRNYYKDRPKVGYKVAYNNMINKEHLVDEYLEKMKV